MTQGEYSSIGCTCLVFTLSWIAASNDGYRWGTGLKDLRMVKSIKPNVKVEQVNSKGFSPTLRVFVLH